MKFFDFFPTPRFLRLAEAGISISDKAVRFISFRADRSGNLLVEKYGEIPLPEGVVAGGIVNDKRVLTNAIAELKTKHGFRYVAATLPEERSYLYVTQVDRLPYKDLKDAVAFTIEENVPVSLAESVFSFEVLDTGKDIKAAVCVLPTEISQTYIEVLEGAGVSPVSFDIESQAIGKALIAKGDKRTHLIIHIGEHKVGLYLVEDEVVQFSSIVNLDSPNPEQPEASSGLKAEIRKFFVFWNTRLDKDGNPGRKVERIIFSGAGASNDKLVADLMTDIETPFALANVWINACSFEKRLPILNFDTSLVYASAIGAAIGSSKHEYV